ncbi:hypothetical protein [Pontimicrobium sp. MEBiC01747]
MKKCVTFILLAFALVMTSCSPDDEQFTNIEQINEDNSDPTPEHEGDDEELEPNE